MTHSYSLFFVVNCCKLGTTSRSLLPFSIILQHPRNPMMLRDFLQQVKNLCKLLLRSRFASRHQVHQSTPSKGMKLLLKYPLLASRKFELRTSRVGLERRGMMFLLRGWRRICMRRWETSLRSQSKVYFVTWRYCLGWHRRCLQYQLRKRQRRKGIKARSKKRRTHEMLDNDLFVNWTKMRYSPSPILQFPSPNDSNTAPIASRTSGILTT